SAGHESLTIVTDSTFLSSNGSDGVTQGRGRRGDRLLSRGEPDDVVSAQEVVRGLAAVEFLTSALAFEGADDGLQRSRPSRQSERLGAGRNKTQFTDRSEGCEAPLGNRPQQRRQPVEQHADATRRRGQHVAFVEGGQVGLVLVVGS